MQLFFLTLAYMYKTAASICIQKRTYSYKHFSRLYCYLYLGFVDKIIAY